MSAVDSTMTLRICSPPIDLPSPSEERSSSRQQKMSSSTPSIPTQCQVQSEDVRLAIRHYPAIAQSRKDRSRICAVVLVHGFAGNQDEGGLFPELCRNLQSAGIHAFSYDCRGVGESSDGADYGQTNLRTHVADFENVLQWVCKNLDTDQDSICGLGFSLGAAIIGLSLQYGTKLGRLVYLCPATRPAVSMWPRYNQRAVWESIDHCGYFTKPESGIRLGAPILKDLERTDLGPSCFRTQQPLLVCHGTADSRIPIAHTEAAMKHADEAQTTFFRVPGASHSFKPSERCWPKLSRQIVDWLDTRECSGPQSTVDRHYKLGR